MDKTEHKGKMLVYDLALLPHGMTAKQLMCIIKEHKVILYDGSLYPGVPSPHWLEVVTRPEDYVNACRIVNIHDEPELYLKIKDTCNDNP